MQIQLKQDDLIAGAKMFLESKGLNLKGKQIDVEFSMNRKPAGVVAEVTISEVEIPGFTDADDDRPKTDEALAKSPVTLAVNNDAPKQEEAAPAAEDPAPVEQAVEDPKPAPTSSLFDA